jgi:hypothetical protein
MWLTRSGWNLGSAYSGSWSWGKQNRIGSRRQSSFFPPGVRAIGKKIFEMLIETGGLNPITICGDSFFIAVAGLGVGRAILGQTHGATGADQRAGGASAGAAEVRVRAPDVAGAGAVPTGGGVVARGAAFDEGNRAASLLQQFFRVHSRVSPDQGLVAVAVPKMRPVRFGMLCRFASAFRDGQRVPRSFGGRK